MEDELVGKDNAIALDYIISKRKALTSLDQAQQNLFTLSDQHSHYRNALTVSLKNAVMFHIVKYRE